MAASQLCEDLAMEVHIQMCLPTLSPDLIISLLYGCHACDDRLLQRGCALELLSQLLYLSFLTSFVKAFELSDNGAWGYTARAVAAELQQTLPCLCSCQAAGMYLLPVPWHG